MSDGYASEAVILVKSLPETTNHAGGIVYHAVTHDGHWHQLPAQWPHARPLKRWEQIAFRWQPFAEGTVEQHKRIDANTIEVVGELPQEERAELLALLEVAHLPNETGARFVLLRPTEPKFSVQKKTAPELAEEQKLYDAAKPGAQKPIPYHFKYSFVTEAGPQEIFYQDPEMNATFTNLSNSFGEAQTVARILNLYGKEYPRKGMLLVMERRAEKTAPWLIRAMIVGDEISGAATARSLNLVV